MGSVFLLTANATLFGSLLFGFAFLWTVAPGWPPPVWFAASWVEFLAGLGGAALAAVSIRRARRANLRGDDVRLWLALTFVGAVALAVAAGAIVLRAPTPDQRAYGATLMVMGGYALFHAALGGLMTAFLAARVARGFTSPVRRAEFPVVALWIDYLAGVGSLVLLFAHLPGLLA